MKADRALVRMRQSTKEVAGTVRPGDNDFPCRVRQPEPQTLDNYRPSRMRDGTETDTAQDQIRRTHEQAERYLQDQMRAVRLLQQQCSAARQTPSASGKRHVPIVQLDNRG
jgi:hypothetical protein